MEASCCIASSHSLRSQLPRRTGRFLSTARPRRCRRRRRTPTGKDTRGHLLRRTFRFNSGESSSPLPAMGARVHTFSPLFFLQPAFFTSVRSARPNFAQRAALGGRFTHGAAHFPASLRLTRRSRTLAKIRHFLRFSLQFLDLASASYTVVSCLLKMKPPGWPKVRVFTFGRAYHHVPLSAEGSLSRHPTVQPNAANPLADPYCCSEPLFSFGFIT